MHSSDRGNKGKMSKGTPPQFSSAKASSMMPLADRGSSNIAAEQRPPKSATSRIRRRNPFSEGSRNNFPDLDEVFETAHVSNSFDDGDDGIDGICQFSDVEGSSVLNMSIGARAALNEHARYIAKYGIDGELNLTDERNSSRDEILSQANTTLLLDNQWERLLDLSQVDSRSGCSIPSPPNISRNNDANTEVLVENARHELSTSIEVMTDVSYDFFNSSRVKLLITPERNQNRQMVVTRDGEGTDVDNAFGDNDCFKFGGEGPSNPTTTSNDSVEQYYSSPKGEYFNVGDISRISNNTNSENDPFPNSAFHENGLCDDAIDRFDTVLGEPSPSRLLNESSSFPSFLVNPFERRQSAFSEQAGNSTSSLQSTVSSFIAEAKTMAKQVVSDVEKSIGSMESLQADFLRAMDIGRTSTPSPISHAFSTPSDPAPHSHSGTFSNSQHASSTEKISTKVNNSSSLSSSTLFREGSRQLQLTGRKRYRTVVPRRVYIDAPGQQHSFDEEQDSFVAVRSNPETSRSSRRLLDSFEEAATYNTL